MEPIISPWLFYFVHVCSNISIFSTIVSIICGWILVALFLAPVSFLKAYRVKICKIAIIVMCCTITLSIFIPSEATLTKMIIANYITQDNVGVVQNNTIEFINKVVEATRQR